jgi:methylenetetrahydrofolate dehydrogenase (NADP+)/methenyltetrahydrofolate cyclohydrolase
MDRFSERSQFMGGTIIDGKKISGEIREELQTEIKELRSCGITPGLATILVGDDPASQVYVRNKGRACEEIGIYSEQIILSGDTPQAVLLEKIRELNQRKEINGILVQLPLPSHIDEKEVLLAISPDKDVDGFHPVNVGKFFTLKRFSEMIDEGLFLPCTPHGIIELLRRSGVEMKGREAVVVGRSNIVGKPVSMLLLANDATVTTCHSRTRNLPDVCRRADILVAAIGRAEFITSDMVKDGVAVIDVGVNRVDAPDTERGYKLVGDVQFEGVMEKASFITPVPGGVGPMTITMLLVNTVKAAKNQMTR